MASRCFISSRPRLKPDPVLSKILIANRGEVALRVIRACHELDMPCVAVYSEADIDSLHVKEADESICIGPGPVGESYLKISHIIGAAEITGCDAIHPGYGFLAENPEFVLACEDNDMVFIGPGAEIMRRMGDKSLAKQTMKQARIPVVPGSEGSVADASEAAKLAAEYGYPVMVKASAGGGGRGPAGLPLVGPREKYCQSAGAAGGLRAVVEAPFGAKAAGTFPTKISFGGAKARATSGMSVMRRILRSAGPSVCEPGGSWRTTWPILESSSPA